MGTAMRSLYTMFEITFSGGWPQYASPIIHDISWLYSIFFVGYVYFVVFAVLRIITALFLKETLQVAQSDAELLIQERLKQGSADAEKVRRLFFAADKSNDGRISLEEFEQFLALKEVRAYMSLLDVSTLDVQSLFDVLKNTGGTSNDIGYDDFFTGIMKCRGPARSVDMISLQRDLKKILQHM